MSLTSIEQKGIVRVIDKLYAGTIPAEADMVNDDVNDLVTKVINEIAACTQRMDTLFESLNEFFSFLYDKTPISELIEKFGADFIVDKISEWMNEIEKEFSVRSCTLFVLITWKSPIAYALQGLGGF